MREGVCGCGETPASAAAVVAYFMQLLRMVCIAAGQWVTYRARFGKYAWQLAWGGAAQHLVTMACEQSHRFCSECE